MRERLVARVASIIDYAAFYTGSDAKRHATRQAVARRTAGEILDAIEKEMER